MIAFIKRIMAAVRRRQRYLKRWQRDLTGKNRIPKTKIGTLDSAKIKAEKSKTIRVVYLFGMPRTGSTLMKHHLGGGAQFALHPFSASYYDAWVFSKQNSKGQIVIDKRTKTSGSSMKSGIPSELNVRWRASYAIPATRWSR